MERLKAYKFRIYPTEEQETFFAQSLLAVSVKVYNLMLDDRMKAYKETRKIPLKNEFSNACKI